MEQLSKKIDKDVPIGFIKEFLKTEGIDVEQLMQAMPTGSLSTIRIKILLGCTALIEAHSRYMKVQADNDDELHRDIMGVLEMFNDIHKDLSDLDGSVSDEDAKKIAQAMLKMESFVKKGTKN